MWSRAARWPHDQRRQRIGQNVTKRHSHFAHADRLGGLDKWQLAQRERIGTDNAGNRWNQRIAIAMITFGSDGPRAASRPARGPIAEGCKYRNRWKTRSTQPDR